jgi:hypothetical protein
VFSGPVTLVNLQSIWNLITKEAVGLYSYHGVQRVPLSLGLYTYICLIYWWENWVDQMINYIMPIKLETRRDVILNERLNMISPFPKLVKWSNIFVCIRPFNCLHFPSTFSLTKTRYKFFFSLSSYISTTSHLSCIRLLYMQELLMKGFVSSSFSILNCEVFFL